MTIVEISQGVSPRPSRPLRPRLAPFDSQTFTQLATGLRGPAKVGCSDDSFLWLLAWRMATVIDVDTSIGSFAVELYERHAPLTCKNFTELARRGYYNGCPFHRIVPGFVIQGGDPTGTGRGGTSIYDGKPFADELTTGAFTHSQLL